jgi:hypothetical protein
LQRSTCRLKALKHFCETVWLSYKISVIEFQKRGLLHTHVVHEPP